MHIYLLKADRNISLFYVQDERYVMMPWMAKNDDVQIFLRHPAFQGITTSQSLFYALP